MANCAEVSKLCKRYGDFFLEDVSFAIPEGTVMGLIGENGAGKSTIIRLMLKPSYKDDGKVFLFGQHIGTSVPVAVKDDIGVVFDECYYPDTCNALQMAIIFSNIYTKWDNALFLRLLKRFDVPEKKKMKEMSRGNKMKLSIICAIAHRPRLLVLDEPTSGLDPLVRSAMLDLLQTFMEDERRSILFSSHITVDLERIADHITCIHNGKLRFSEQKDDLLNKYAIFKGTRQQFEQVGSEDFINIRYDRYGVEALCKNKEEAAKKYPQLTQEKVTIDDILSHSVGNKSYQESEIL